MLDVARYKIIMLDLLVAVVSVSIFGFVPRSWVCCLWLVKGGLYCRRLFFHGGIGGDTERRVMAALSALGPVLLSRRSMKLPHSVRNSCHSGKSNFSPQPHPS